MPLPESEKIDHRVEWSAEQEEYVRLNYDGKGSELAKVLPFSGAAIRNKAKRLGVVNHSHFHHFFATELPKIKVADLAYIAGFLDGEGSIFQNNKKCVHQWKVNFCNTDKDVIYWIYKTIGEIGKIRSYQPRGHQNKVAYLLDIIRQGDIYSLLLKLRRYLHTKKKKADATIKDIRNHKKLMISGG